MNITLRQLEVFLKVIEYQSVTRAAEELYLSQPAVSSQLKKLQDQFDGPLTEVVGRQLYVTDFGREIAASAQKILAEVETIRYHGKALGGKLAGRLKVTTASTGKYVMPYFLTDFLLRHPGVDLQMDVTNKLEVVKNLEDNLVDFSLVSVLPKHLSLHREELMHNKLYLVGGTVLAGGKKLTAHEVLTRHSLLLREEGSATRNAMVQFLKNKNLPPLKNIELTSNEAIKQALMAGLGVTIMPLIGIRNELENGQLTIFPMRGLPLVTHWNLVWRSEKKLTPVAGAFLNFIRSEKHQIIKEWFDWYETY